MYKQIEKYSPEQEKLHNYIKSLHDSGMSYRRITKLLNEKGITTHRGKRWGVTGNSVYSVLKRHKQRGNFFRFPIGYPQVSEVASRDAR